MNDMLIDREFVRAVLTREADWAWSHGAEDGYLGMGLLYYTLTYIRQPRIAVCLGSGGGFVPRLMRQAQRDLGIADRSRTILVDANRPEAGWGAPAWLNEDSFFRRRFADVELVLSTTAEAAEQVFAKQGLTINLLHIDADHSFSGCFDDYRRYRQFLETGSLITFHDTGLSGAGVHAVVEYLRSRGDCEVIDFPNIGCGTAIARFVAEAERPPIPSAARGASPNTGAVVAARKADAPALAPPGMGWNYLESEAFSVRSVLAAQFLRDCPMVIEIGGGRVTIDSFLTGRHQQVVVVDPFLRERPAGKPDDDYAVVQHIRARFQDIEWRIERPGQYGVVMLGLELQGLSEQDWQILFALVSGARATVIEFPSSWPPSFDQFRAICRNTRTRERFTCKLDLSGNDVGSLENSWPPRFDREIHVLEPIES